jgi:hypothetical protein
MVTGLSHQNSTLSVVSDEKASSKYTSTNYRLTKALARFMMGKDISDENKVKEIVPIGFLNSGHLGKGMPSLPCFLLLINVLYSCRTSPRFYHKSLSTYIL